MSLFAHIKDSIKGKDLRIVFPEGTDGRILDAVARLHREQIVIPILLGDPKEVEKAAVEESVDIEGVKIIDPKTYEKMDEMIDAFVERRKGKNTKEEAKELLQNVNYFGTMMTHMGLADCMISGAIHPTGDTVRPALQIVKTRPGISKVSGAFLMLGPEGKKYIFSDCAINISPNAQELAEIAVGSAKTAKAFGIEPRIAMMSFSTKGSAAGPEVDKVREATEIAKNMHPEIEIDGEMQFDAALVDTVAKQKAPNSNVAGRATVFIFPSLEAGNIGYKIAQRFGHFEAIGPILVGLNKPISDLSRGCNKEDVYKLAILTAAQTQID